LWLLALLTG
jgi:serine/threonine-protein phosphatase 2A regulatory subunit B'